MGRSLIGGIKLASENIRANSQPTDLRYGTVVSINPLSVRISAELTLPQSTLVVPQHLTNYTVGVSVNWTTENKSGGSGEASFSSHNHSISGGKSITINNALKVGDKVALLRQEGGQSYFILDRI